MLLFQDIATPKEPAKIDIPQRVSLCISNIALDLESSRDECTLSADVTPTEWIICNMAEQPELPPQQHATLATLSENIPQLRTNVVFVGPSTLLLRSDRGMFHVSGYFKYQEAALESLREMEIDSSEEDSDSCEQNN